MTTNNHPAHGPVSLDRLHQIREILSKAAAQIDGGNLGYAMADAVKVIDGVLESIASEQVRCEHAAWSQATFGGVGPVGPLKHLSKELAKLFRKITNSEIDAEGNAHVVLSPADSLLINNARIALASLEAAEKRIAELEARAFNPAILDVIAERQRQQSVEGWMPEHDDEHCNGELAMAAVCYINETGTVNRNGGKPWGWPWDASWWKPNARRRNLVKAGALILAEIERIDRAAGIGKGE
ncbi:DUF550 domain-containing protein [Escherichia coli]|nr:DUF550 domain-containing protein [Escherichia coli]